MSLFIRTAHYHEIDVTSIIRSAVCGNNLIFHVSNCNLGFDPAPGIRKKLNIVYTINDKEYNEFFDENTDVILTGNNSKVCGLFYTDNSVSNKILKTVIQSVDNAAKKTNAAIFYNAWEKTIEYPGVFTLSLLKNRSHFNIIYQICSMLSAIESSNLKCEYVAFLEHDVLYPVDYFIFDDFNENVLCNTNFVGLEKNGFSYSLGQLPLHQLIMKFDYAVHFYKNLLYKSINKSVCVEPPNGSLYKIRKTKDPSIHINARDGQFTSHRDTYKLTNEYLNHPTFGDYKKILTDLNLLT